MAEASNSSTPEKLGKYTIESELGKGSMGIVYNAMDPVIERRVALKTIRRDFLDPEEADEIISRFKREAQAAGRLNHPNIVTVYEYGEEENTAFLAMEFVNGRELKDIFQNREWFSLDNSIKIMDQLLEALSYSHKKGVVHRDIKPGNIIVMDNGRIKVTDFGIARIESSNLTQLGSVMGTPNYMSPEQVEGQRVDGRSDIFSAGVIFYQLLTGEKPFGGDSITTIMHKVMHVDPINPSELNVSVPTAFDAEIKKALAKNPDDRFQTAAEFAKAIQEAINRGASGKNAKKTKDDATVLQPSVSTKPPKAGKARPAGQPLRKALFIVFLLLLIGFIYNAWHVLQQDLPNLIEKKAPYLKEWVPLGTTAGVKNIEPKKRKKIVTPIKAGGQKPQPKMAVKRAPNKPAPQTVEQEKVTQTVVKKPIKKEAKLASIPKNKTPETSPALVPRVYSRETIPAPDLTQKQSPAEISNDNQKAKENSAGPAYTRRIVSGGGGRVLNDEDW